MSIVCANLGIWSAAGNVAAVAYDGTTNQLTTSSISGLTDTSFGILTFFINPSSGSGQGIMVTHISGTGAGDSIIVQTNAGGTITVTLSELRGSGPTSAYNFTSTSAVNVSAWNSVLIAWNTNQSAGNKVGQIYINGSGGTTSTDISPAFNVALTGCSARVGTNNSILFSGCLSEFFFAPGQFLDFTVAGNRSKFITGTNHPASLGVNGSVPTGTQPRIYLHSAVPSEYVNSGNGGDLTPSGSFSNCGSHP